jgi:hypothetical protein
MAKLQSFKGGRFYETEDPASSRAAGQSGPRDTWYEIRGTRYEVTRIISSSTQIHRVLSVTITRVDVSSGYYSTTMKPPTSLTSDETCRRF